MIEFRLKIIGAVHGVIGVLSLPFLILYFFYGPTAEQLPRKNLYSASLLIGLMWLNVIVCFLILYSLGTLKNWGRYLTIVYDGLLLAYFLIGPVVVVISDPRELKLGLLIFLIPICIFVYDILFLMRPEVKDLMN